MVQELVGIGGKKPKKQCELNMLKERLVTYARSLDLI